MMRFVLILARNSRGSATLELGLFAPILAAMLVGMIELASSYSNKLQLEQVAQRVVEKVQQTSFSTSMKAALEAEAEAAAGENADAELTWWIECDGVRMADASAFASGCSSGQLHARYIQIDIRRAYVPIVPVKYLTENANGLVELDAAAGIRIQ